MSSSFSRVVVSCLRYRLTVGTSVACALLVGVLWGANIGTVFPFVEVVFQGQSLPEWVDREIDKAHRRIATLDREAQELANRGENDPRLHMRLVRRREAETLAVRKYQTLRPYIYQYFPQRPFPTLGLVVGVLILGTLVKALFLALSTVLTERLAQAGTIRLRKQCFHEVLKMPLSRIQADDAGQLVSRLTFDLEQVTVALRTLFGRTLREPLKMLACLAGAAWVCWRLLLISLLLAPVFGWLISRLNRSVKQANAQALDEMSGIHAVLSDTLRCIKQVKAFTLEGLVRRRFDDVSRRYLARSMKVATVDAFIRPSIEVMTLGVIAVAILAGGYLVLNEQTHLFGLRISARPLSISSLLLFFGLLAGVSDPARKLSGVIGKLQRGAAAADRIFEILQPAVDMSAAGDLPAAPLPRPLVPRALPLMSNSIQFQNVSFRYSGRATDPQAAKVLDGVEFTIHSGETVAFVGPNGCGKSTLMSLLLRFHTPDTGRILIDGQDIGLVRRRDLRRQIGLVSQDSILFRGSVEENIRCGNPQASSEMIRAAAERARAGQFIRNELPDGFQTQVGDGACRLSGGQRQRIALARAFLRDPQILILDEATSQVDLHSERQINQALVEFARNRTMLIVTHRPSALDLADRIIVMQSGKIVADGTQAQLAATCELFRRLTGRGAGKAA